MNPTYFSCLYKGVEQAVVGIPYEHAYSTAMNPFPSPLLLLASLIRTWVLRISSYFFPFYDTVFYPVVMVPLVPAKQTGRIQLFLHSDESEAFWILLQAL